MEAKQSIDNGLSVDDDLDEDRYLMDGKSEGENISGGKYKRNKKSKKRISKRNRKTIKVYTFEHLKRRPNPNSF